MSETGFRVLTKEHTRREDSLVDPEAHPQATMIIDRERSDLLALWYKVKTALKDFIDDGDDDDSDQEDSHSGSPMSKMRKERPNYGMKKVSTEMQPFSEGADQQQILANRRPANNFLLGKPDIDGV